MEAKMMQAFLRVLYTVNSNPQYILAKSQSQIQVFTCSETAVHSTMNELAYARAPLKACLAAVCNSSPELLQDPTRDFSLYFLDPLEAQPLPTGLANAPYNTGSPRGVAVALGLMSWALESNDSMGVFVTGTIIPNASPALEVVCALRETKRISKPILRSYPSLSPISAPGSSQSLNPPQISGMSWLSTSHLQRDQQQQQTLTRSADFPELYIGPPRRARGRPEGSTSSKSKVKAQASASSLAGAGSSYAVGTQSESKQEVERRSKQKTKPKPPRDPPTYSPFICAPLTRNPAKAVLEGDVVGITTFHQQSHPSNRNQSQSHADFCSQVRPQFHPTHPRLELLSAFSSTPSGDTGVNTAPEQQAALLSALQGLLATNPHLLQLATTNTGLSTSNGEKASEEIEGPSNAGDEQDEGDSDIVVLDSSTIDTSMFHKPSTRQRVTNDHNASPHTNNQVSPMPSSDGIGSSPLPRSTPLSGPESTSASSRASTPPSVRLDSISKATADAETPTSKHVWRDSATSHGLDLPETPTVCRTRKRKLDEYRHGQGHSSAPMFPPSPSPSMARTSSSGRALTAKHRVQSSSTVPTVRLPSMLGSMRSIATSGSRTHVSSSDFSTHGHPGALTPDKNENQSTTLFTRPSKPKADHAKTTDASLNDVASDRTSLKRRRTLTEFMAEHEARQNTKARKQSSSRRKSEVDMSANAPQATAPRTANLGSTLRHAQSSSPRPLFRTDSMISALPLRTSTSHIGLVPATIVTNPASSANTVTFTGPSTSASTESQTKNPLQTFVLPAWARTSTAMLPRLSEEVLARQRAERESKKAQVSLRRREAAKAKRKRLRDAGRPSKESSDEDDQTIVKDVGLRMLHPPPSSVASSAPMPQPLPPSLPVFASDTVEPIPSSPPRSCRQPVPPVVPSTPPRKPVSSSVSGTHRTPSKSGSCSLFTPSGKDSALFTPNTPSVTRSLTRTMFTLRSPTMLHGSGCTKSPRKSLFQGLRRNSSDHPTPRSLQTDRRNPPFVSPSTATRTPQAQTGMGTRAFLLPPPSPCALRVPRQPNQAHSRVSDDSTLVVPSDSGTVQQRSAFYTQDVEQDEDCQEDMLNRELEEALLGVDATLPLAPCSPSRPARGKSEPHDITSGDANAVEEDYASSPLPPSSPLPASPLSSPAKHDDGSLDINHVAVPNLDMLLPSADGSNGPRKAPQPAWFSDDTNADAAAMWVTESEVSAWLTETEAWLTDTEGGRGPLLSDSDGTGARLSDPDAVFGDMSSLASNWLSDDVDVDTDEGDFGATGDDGLDTGLDTVAFQRACMALAEHGGRVVGKDSLLDSGTTTTHSHSTPPRVVPSDSEFWQSMQPFLGGGGASNDAGATQVAQDIRALLDGLVGS